MLGPAGRDVRKVNGRRVCPEKIRKKNRRQAWKTSDGMKSREGYQDKKMRMIMHGMVELARSPKRGFAFPPYVVRFSGLVLYFEKTMAYFLKVVFLVLSCLCLAPSCDRQGDVSLPTEEALGKELKANEKLVHYERELLSGLKREIVRARILDETTNSVTEIIWTTKSSDPRDYLALRKMNRKAIRARHGAGGEGFEGKMNSRPTTALPFTVQFIADADVRQATQRVARLGATIERRFNDMIRIKAAPTVAKRIARLASVEAIVEDPPRILQALSMARDLEQTQLALKHAAGFGRDLLVAIWEPEACVNRTHPDFQKIQWQHRFSPECDPQSLGFHSTKVANAFAAFRLDGTAGLFQGQMFDVDAESMQAEEDMWSRKPQIINASFTTSVFDGRRIDTEVHKTRAQHVFTGVGNILTNTEQIACFGYNALCVGGYLHNGTIGGYADDTLGPSSWRNLNEIEKPQVLGPYAGGKLATSFFAGGPLGYSSASGSSFATPAVAGLGALLIANYPFELVRQPEAVRAVLMASAHVHPIVSENRVIPDFSDNIDDRMGVGAPNGLRAKKIMDEHFVRHGSFIPTLPGQPGLGVVTFPAELGDSVRVVLTWEQCPDYNVADPQLSVDLDMVAAAPAQLPGPGQPPTRFSNFSRHDNWEVVQFTMPRSGSVAIHVSAPMFRPCNLSPNPRAVNFGLAWSTMPDVLPP